ncbi:unnamed protein product [Effrenium voratum]|nr:unnamed protein product [Effrenium voratum]
MNLPNPTDVDIQVSRSADSNRANVSFTDLDKQKVAQNLEKLELVSDVKVGNVAIKFLLLDMKVDLVLQRDRPEEFPALRGGPDFYQNSARINGFLEDVPAARAALCGLKCFLAHPRPKGILLEAITWRMAQTGRVPLTKCDLTCDERPGKWEALVLFLEVLQDVATWEEAFFGGDLKSDLSILPDRERQKYELGLSQCCEDGSDKVIFQLLAASFWWQVCLQEGLFAEGKTLGAVEQQRVLDRLKGCFEEVLSE